jgi:predicted permease
MVLETTLLLVASVATGVALAWWGNTLLTKQLTVSMRDALANPLDLDGRAIAFMSGVALVTGALTLLPLLFRVSRADVVSGFRDDPRTMPASRGAARLRQLLMTGQVALTVVLLVGALLYIRTYDARVSRDTGLDLARVVTIGVYPSRELVARVTEFADELLARLRSAPFVTSVAGTNILPPSTDAGTMGNLLINGSAESAGRPMLSFYGIDPEYFPTLGITLVSGQALNASSPRDSVIVDEEFAQQYWPAGDAVGSRFKNGGGVGGITDFHIVGVSRRLRADRAETPTGEHVFVVYMRLMREEHPAITSFVAKLSDADQLEALTALVRSISGRSIVRVDTLEARYARLEGDTRLTAAITTGFGAMALIVAISGIYAVMAFLVAGRSREIGIRMALGADRGHVRRLILSSSLRFVVAGAVLGLVAAAMLSRAIVSQLYGVGPTDPTTYGAVAALMVITAIAATWWPARRASRVDPAVTLRRE